WPTRRARWVATRPSSVRPASTSPSPTPEPPAARASRPGSSGSPTSRRRSRSGPDGVVPEALLQPREGAARLRPEVLDQLRAAPAGRDLLAGVGDQTAVGGHHRGGHDHGFDAFAEHPGEAERVLLHDLALARPQ